MWRDCMPFLAPCQEIIARFSVRELKNGIGDRVAANRLPHGSTGRFIGPLLYVLIEYKIILIKCMLISKKDICQENNR